MNEKKRVDGSIDGRRKQLGVQFMHNETKQNMTESHNIPKKELGVRGRVDLEVAGKRGGRNARQRADLGRRRHVAARAQNGRQLAALSGLGCAVENTKRGWARAKK
jgi:hypothetical protein